MPIKLCVLLWPNPGQANALITYEDRVLGLLAEHGGRVLQRARTDGEGEAPLEIQMLEFPSRAELEAYLADERRGALRADRDRAIGRTDAFEIEILA